jgi:glycerate kinase
MKILIAPSAYKGTIAPNRLAEIMAEGVQRANPAAQIELAPLADGGDGTIEVLRSCLGGEVVSTTVEGADGEVVSSRWLKIGPTAIVELACACGLALLKDKRRQPLKASTMGLGQVIADCLNFPVSHILIALGGSASTDGGTGALTALGVKFLDKDGKLLAPGGGALISLDRVELAHLDGRIGKASIELAVDVEAPLLGTRGAAHNFAAQKGASVAEIDVLEAGLTKFADIIERTVKRSFRDIPGSGAAGGTAFGLMAGLGASITPGFSAVAKLIELNKKLENTDLLITAEGRLDEQSFQGKATGELAKLCWKRGVPLWVVAGSVADELRWQNLGIERLFTSATPGEIASEQDVIEASARIFNNRE